MQLPIVEAEPPQTCRSRPPSSAPADWACGPLPAGAAVSFAILNPGQSLLQSLQRRAWNQTGRARLSGSCRSDKPCGSCSTGAAMAETSRPPVPPWELFPTPDCAGVGFQLASGAIGSARYTQAPSTAMLARPVSTRMNFKTRSVSAAGIGTSSFPVNALRVKRATRSSSLNISALMTSQMAT